MPTKTRPCRTGKHHGPEGRTESKICVSRGRNVPSEISYKKESCCLLPAAACRSCLLLAAACSCLLLAVAGCCWLLLAAAGCLTPAAAGCCCRMLPARHVLLPAAGCCWLVRAAAGCCWLLPAACCLLLPAAAWQYKSSSAAPLLPLRAPPCIGQGQRIIIILSWQLCHKLFFPYALPLASAGVGGYVTMRTNALLQTPTTWKRIVHGWGFAVQTFPTEQKINIETRRRLARERKRCVSSSSEYGSRKR